MKKIFYQFNFRAVLLLIICMLITIGSVYVTALSLVEKDAFMFVIGLCSIAILGYSSIATFNNRLVFYDNYLEITGHIGKNTDKIQFHDKINFSDIEDVKIVSSNKNSKKQKFAWNDVGNIVPKMYFEFILKNQESKWVHIDSFSKRQRKQMLDIINLKTGAQYIYEELVNTSVSK